MNHTRLLIRIFEFAHAGHSAGQLRRIHDQHAGVLEAILQGDATLAADRVSTHIAGSRDERLLEFEMREQDSSLRRSLSVSRNDFSGSARV